MSERKSLSKRTRFEIFKRDSFRCVYCGVTPMQRDLRVDHVIAVANGGTDDPPNLVTTCDPCNAGKSSVPLERKKFAPVQLTEAMEDRAELVRVYLENVKRHDEAITEAAVAVQEVWGRHIGGMSNDMFSRMKKLVREWPIEKLHEAIEITGRRVGTPGAAYRSRDAVEQSKYFSGVLRRWREEGTADASPSESVESDDALRGRFQVLVDLLNETGGRITEALQQSPSADELSQSYRATRFCFWFRARANRAFADLGWARTEEHAGIVAESVAAHEELERLGRSHPMFLPTFEDGAGI
jgi:hypothetical protein